MTSTFSEAEIAEISGQRAKDEFLRAGSGPWTVLYDFEGIDESPISAATFSVLAPPGLRSKFLSSGSWDATVGFGQPGTMTTYAETKSTTYLPLGNDQGMEPLVIVTDSAGTRKSEILINQEFRLVFELFEDKETGNLVKVFDDGTEEIVVEITGEIVRVRSSYLARFRALKQLDLWLYTNVISHFPEVSQDTDFEQFATEWKNENSAGSNNAGTSFGRTTSYFNAKKFFAPGPVEKCNLWEYEDRNRTYEDFIIGEDEFGKPVTFTCEEDKLANYFGKNPEAPHYLTPVFFRKDVLLKYYNHAELYTVTDGSVSCDTRWYLRMDNDHEEYVAVFLGDLGRDLPDTERQYWKGFNIAPRGPMSSTYSQRAYEGRWVDAQQPDHQFKSAYADLQNQWNSNHGWQIYREPHDADKSIINRLHVPLNETQSEFEDQLMNLAKLLVDFLNEKAIVKAIGKGPEGERGLSKLQRFFTVTGYKHVEEDNALLRQIQELRSRVSAHSKGSDYNRYIAGKLGGMQKKEFVMELLRNSTEMLKRWADFSPVYAAYRESQS
ncbi:hypothetical protein ACFY5D_20920 [Paeniglutamicibacter sp. NPDC012692]|uniref:hypothetical protein n=1 Tax=Paeniglutamicibacter sp. NPDC012692 TaxID=3364388 RepID=UPI0036A16FED